MMRVGKCLTKCEYQEFRCCGCTLFWLLDRGPQLLTHNGGGGGGH